MATNQLRWLSAAVILVALQWVIRFVLPLIWEDAVFFGVIAGTLSGLLVLAWWVFLSRAPKPERWGGAALIVALMWVTHRLLLDKSVATGMMSMMLLFYAIPTVCLALVLWAWAVGRNPNAASWWRWSTMVAALTAATAGWALVRTDGIRGAALADLHWRWTETHEDKLKTAVQARLPEAPPAPPTPSPAPAAATPAPAVAAAPAPEAAAAPPPKQPQPPEAKRPAPAPVVWWAGFRGSLRDNVVAGLRIRTEWSGSADSKPAELWRRPIGPGWGSFAIVGNRLYTQEQRGEEEVVTCYDAATGQPIWAHRDAARFWESNAGAGPRGTPEFHDGRIYSFGATGILNALDAETGAVVWRRDVGADTEVKVPGWGFSSSPLVMDGMVIVAASSRLAAYDLANGAPRWMGPKGGGGGYSSPHRLERRKTDGSRTAMILLMGAQGIRGHSSADGRVLWSFDWPTGTRIVQPVVLEAGEGDLLVSGDSGDGIKRVAVTADGASWKAEERWTSKGLKPYFSDLVVHGDHAYGFDSAILSCIALSDGTRRWKGGRYGQGQMMLLRDQGLLLVISEEGELVLVRADPGEFTEVARMPAIEGKTWNHPALAGNRLFVRNGNEMAAFRLPRLPN